MTFNFNSTGAVNINDFDIDDDDSIVNFNGGGTVNIDDFDNGFSDDRTRVTFAGGVGAGPVYIRRFQTYSDDAEISFTDRADVYIDLLRLFGDDVDVSMTPGNYFFKQWQVTRSRAEIRVKKMPSDLPVNISSEYVRFSQDTDLNWDNSLGGGDPEDLTLYVYPGPFSRDVYWTDPVRMNGVVVAQPCTPNTRFYLNADSHKLHGAFYTQGALDIGKLQLTYDGPSRC